ncbi:interference hedgehog-like [Aricia agestis]|uniref:interference hedgehog-like n=1 Tax=Aricia agestis TaxID=91739 RepID=UPI001C20991A|nr:interference hedgehog-like [Aricia agestis]
MGSKFLLRFILGVVLPVMAEIEMEFTKSPESVTAPVGDTVTFECAVKVPGERLAWRWRPVGGHQWNDWKDIAGANDKDSVSTRLMVEIKEDKPTALYQCVVWYGAISLVSIPAKLSIAKLDLSRNVPEKRVITAPLNNNVVLHCKEPLSEPPAVLSWWKEEKGSRKPLNTPHGVLVINNATVDNSGTYGCSATNELSGQTEDLPERIFLKVQHEGNGGTRFLESKDYVGTIDRDGALTKSVRPDGCLRLWCGVVETPPPKVTWYRDNRMVSRDHTLVVAPFTPEEEGIYTCSSSSTSGVSRSWKAISLQAPSWEGTASSVNASEGDTAHVSCGVPHGTPKPLVHWLLNAEAIKTGKGIRTTDSDLFIDRVEKRHAGIVQCFACNDLGCAYDAAILSVVPVQISDQEFSVEAPKTLYIPSQPPKRHNRKNTRKHKAILVPPSRPNVTRLSDDSVMVSWTHANHGLPIFFYKVQYREVSNNSNVQWHTANTDIASYIHSFQVDGLIPDRYYKFRIAAVYSNQDNKMGRSSNKFYLQRGGFQKPKVPVLDKATALSPHSIQLNWTWSSDGGVEAEGFYVYFRAVSSAGSYEKVTVGGDARTLVLDHLTSDTAYELKIQAYTAQAPSEFSAILVAKTQRSSSGNASVTVASSTSAPTAERAPSALLTGGVAGAVALLLLLALALLLCRRARRLTAHKEKPAEGTNGYIPGKVPITITANPMHAEGSDGGVEMSFLHNNNASNDDTPRKNGPRQYV